MSVYFPQVVIPTSLPQTTLELILTVQGDPPTGSLAFLRDASWKLQAVFTENTRIQKFPFNPLQGEFFLIGHKYTESKAVSARLITLTGEDQSFYLDIDEGQRPQGGDGLLSGSFPLSMLTNEGNLPSQAEIRILYRPNTGDLGDGYVVATTTCNADGTWQVSGLDEDLKFDIVARIPGYNDVLISDVQPTGAPLTAHFAGIKEEYEYEEEVSIQVVALGGRPPYNYAVNTLPEGLTFDSSTGYITGSMPAGDLMISITVTDAVNGSVTITWEGTVVNPLPTIIGEPFGGGFYAGDIQSDGQWYKLIVADVSADITGANSIWKTTTTSTAGTDHLTNGVANTSAMIAAGIELHPAAAHCIDHRGGDNADWYMPAKDELNVIYQNLGFNRPNCPPDFQAGGPQAFSDAYYWSSTQNSSTWGWGQRFSDGNQNNLTKTTTNRRVRPVRRLQFNP